MTAPNRLKLIGLITITLLIMLSSYFFIVAYVNLEKTQALKTILTNNSNLSSILTETGKERGLTSMYLGSNKQEFTDSLQNQRKSTDKTLTSIKESLIVKDTSDIPFLFKLLGENNPIETNKYKLLLSKINMLPVIRKEVDDNNPDFKKIFFDGYIKNFSTPALDNLLQINNFTLNTEISSLISTLSKLYITKENSGFERDLVAYHMTQKASMSHKEIASLDGFKMKSNIFNYTHISNPQLQQQLKQIFNNPKNIEIFTKLTKISSVIRTDVISGHYTEEIIDWFSLQTQKISLLSKAELIISNTLWEKNNIFLQKQLFMLAIATFIWLLSFILAYLGYITTRNIINNIQEFEDMPNKAVNEAKSLFLSSKSSHNNMAINDNDSLNNDITNKPHTEEETVIKKKILIGKKFLLERRILIKVIENLGYSYISLDNLDNFLEEITSGKYDIVFTDNSLITDDIKKIATDINIITNNKSKKEIKHLILKQRK